MTVHQHERLARVAELRELLRASVHVADDRLGAGDDLAVELDHDPEHAVGRRVLGTHVDDHRLVFADLDVDVAGVEGRRPLGRSHDAAFLDAPLGCSRSLAREHLLGPLRGLGDQAALVFGVAHRGLNGVRGLP